ncbi:claudin-19 [Menidia menidia]|uniref:(Atlantic silverside) hypothetical protein n=1 Tax=Menidia menidia TaxID=238744 RepID=A0A8S4AG75_9TELE|nr:unnamed protein product [Menidia menidia]
MASSALQLLGFLISLVGVAANTAAIFMVEWRKEAQGKFRIYEGLWMTCSGTERTTCEIHQSVLKLSTEIQATRAVMLVSLFLSAVAVMVSTVGMKCTRFMDSMPRSKSMVALAGGIMFMVSGLLVIAITSWYVKVIVQTFKESHRLQSREFGNAVFVSWAGGLLTMIGGVFLSCQRCCGGRSSESLTSNELLHATKPKSNYV